MINFNITKTKYAIHITSNFKNSYKKIVKQRKDKNKLINVLKILANGEILDTKYREHNLQNDKKYKDCKECHIEPDWLLIYKYDNDNLILILMNTGSHSEVFKLI